MPFVVYILYSERFDKYYIGQTSSMEMRLERHNEFELTNSFTSKYRPWKIMAWVETGDYRSSAMKVESRLKALKSKKMIARFAQQPDLLLEFAKQVLAHI